MGRPPRLTYPGAQYHITSRGNNKGDIFQSEIDFNIFLAVLGQTIDKYGWECLSYCLMNNHYHLYIKTPIDNISKGMKYLNGGFAKLINRNQNRSGHLFQGRFHSVLIKDDKQALAVVRYIILNPVRAGIVKNPSEWKWSSFRPTIGLDRSPRWLNHDEILSYFHTNKIIAISQYSEYVSEGIGLASPLHNIKNNTL